MATVVCGQQGRAARRTSRETTWLAGFPFEAGILPRQRKSVVGLGSAWPCPRPQRKQKRARSKSPGKAGIIHHPRPRPRPRSLAPVARWIVRSPASRQQTRRVGGRRGGPSPTRVVFRTVATVRFGGLRAQHRLAACRCGASVPHHMLLGHRKLPRHLLCYQITPPTERHQPGDGQFRLMLYCASILAPSLVQIICPP